MLIPPRGSTSVSSRTGTDSGSVGIEVRLLGADLDHVLMRFLLGPLIKEL
jgi:hypothetical protein